MEMLGDLLKTMQSVIRRAGFQPRSSISWIYLFVTSNGCC